MKLEEGVVMEADSRRSTISVVIAGLNEEKRIGPASETSRFCIMGFYSPLRGIHSDLESCGPPSDSELSDG
jgi:hypothetical protein